MSAYSTLVLADRPARYYRLNETSGTTATDLASGQNGTYTGGYTLNQGGALLDDTDPAVALNGSTGYVAIPSWTSTSESTIEMWWQRSAAAAGMVLGNSGGSGYVMLNNPASNGWTFQATSTSSAFVIPNSPEGTWHHLVLLRHGGTVRVFHDGVESTTGAQSNSNSQVFDQIGRYTNGGSGYWWNGLVDEVALYDYALPLDRIVTHYTEGRRRGYEDEVLAAGALAYWPLSNRFDRSGYGRHLTETNAPAYTATNPIASADKAATFNGTSNYLQIARDDSWMAQQYHSTIMWFRTNATGRMIPVDRDSSGSSQRVFTFEINQPSAGQMAAVTYGQNNAGAAVVNTSGLSINDNAWHMAVRTHGTDFYTRIFVDGVECASASLGAASGTGDLPIYVGVHGNISFLYQGDLAHVSYHAGALTAAQVRRLYAARLIPPRRAVAVG